MRRKYSVLRTTQGLKVPYYVKENFHTEYQGSLRRLEISVEEEYLSNLRHACFREKSYSKYCYSIDSKTVVLLVRTNYFALEIIEGAQT